MIYKNMRMLKKITLRTIPVYIGVIVLFYFANPINDFFFIAGIILIVVGEFFRIWGCGHLVKTKEFTISGPYAYVRHPLYFGTYLIATGFILMAHLWWLLFIWQIVFALYYYPRKEVIEGTRLLAIYGDEFLNYMKRVPALFPSLKAYKNTPRKWSFKRMLENSELGIIILDIIGIAILFWKL